MGVIVAVTQEEVESEAVRLFAEAWEAVGRWKDCERWAGPERTGREKDYDCCFELPDASIGTERVRELLLAKAAEMASRLRGLPFRLAHGVPGNGRFVLVGDWCAEASIEADRDGRKRLAVAIKGVAVARYECDHKAGQCPAVLQE